MLAVYVDRTFFEESQNTVGGWKRMPCWPKSFDFDQPYKIYTDLTQYQHCDSQVKVAFYFIDHATSNEFIINCLKFYSSISDLVFVIETEVHSPAVLQSSTVESLCNVQWIMAGTISSYQNKIIPWQYHIWRVSELYKNLPGALELLTPYAPKPRYFDAMLGTKKPHRQFVANQIEKLSLANKIKYALGPMPALTLQVPMNQDSHFVWDPEFEPLPDVDYLRLNQHIKYRGLIVQMPCVIPTSLFNTTAYSIVCETGYENHIHMLSEKTAKVFLAQRLFVMFAGAGMLQFIRDQGFKTFDGIIDESYDLIQDNNQRWAAAFEQVLKLCSMDQTEVLNRIRPICEHNLKHATSDLEFVPKAAVYNQIKNLLDKFSK